MKTLNYPQKKWVLAVTLLAVLGFNASFNPQPAMTYAADLASSAVIAEEQVATVDGVMPVTYLKGSQSQILAVVPKKMTEGKVCDSCGYETISLGQSNHQDIKALNVKLLQELQKSKATKNSSATTESATEEKKNPFESIEKSCRRHNEKSDLLSCTADKFISLLRKKDTPDLDKVDTMNFYKQNIENLIYSEISDARRSVNKMRRASTTIVRCVQHPCPYSFEDDPQEILEKSSDMRENTLKVIRSLISGLPGKYEDIRKRLLVAETEIAREEARELQKVFSDAKSSSNPAQGVYLYKEGEFRRMELQGLLQGMRHHTFAGLDTATRNKDLNADLQRQYEDFFHSFSQKMIDNMWQNPYSVVGSTEPISTLPGSRLGQRIAEPRRGGSITPMNSNPNYNQRYEIRYRQ